MRTRQGCWKCGDYPCSGFRWHKCTLDNKDAVWCIGKNCRRAAAMCEENHVPKVSTELSDWLKRSKIKTTVNLSIGSVGVTLSRDTSEVFQGKISDEEIKELQAGTKAKLMPDSELVEYFKNSLVKNGVSKPKVKPYPSGQCVFLFCLIEGKTRPIQAFIDSGCNTMLSRQSIPETELVSAKLIKGPIPVSVAGGGEIMASGLWATLLPLCDGTNQVAKTLTMDTITADMNIVDLESVYEDIKSKTKEVKALQNLKVPREVGGKVDLLIGFNLLAVHPEPVHTFPSGLTVYKSKFKPPWPGVLGCVGGPVEALQCIAGMSGNIAALANLKSMAYLTKDYVPRLDFFPDLAEKMPVDPEMKHLNLVEDEPETSDFAKSAVDWELHQHEGPGLYPTPDCCQCDPDICHDTETPEVDASFTVGQDIRKFMEYQEIGLDQGYKCPQCRKCKECQRGAGYERISMKQEAEQEIIKSSVLLDEDKNRAVVKLAFIADPVQNLKPNRYSALKRLDNVCRKYNHEPDSVKMICDKVTKLHKAGHVKYWEDLSADQRNKIEGNPANHYLCWDVGFKEGSMSTPARPVFDGSARTPGGTSLNEILAKGITTLARLVEVQLAWVIGKYGLTGDVSQAYNAMLLDEDHWAYQRVLLKDDLDSDNRAREAVITSAIYGVKCVGGQLEVLCRKLADLYEDEYPKVAEFLRKFRYVDDFAKSVDTIKEVKKLIDSTEKVLSKASLIVKDWAWTGEEPPEKMSPDGSSIHITGLVWYPKVDTYRLNLDSLHFAVKKRGRYPPGTIKYEDTQITMNEFVPKKLTRRDCARVAARVYDLRGDVAPLLLRLKYDLRGLILKEYDWDDVLDMESRMRWVENFGMMEKVRQFMFERCKIPKDAVNSKGRLWILVDAADGGLVMTAFVCFLRHNGAYSCQRIFGKGLLCPELWTIPARELQALAIGADTVTFLKNTLADWMEEGEIYVASDSRIALAWVVYERVKLDVYYRNRVSQIRSQINMTKLFHVDGKENIADVGTRPDDTKIEDFSPGSEWEIGKPWMRLRVEEAVENGIIKPVEKIRLEDEEKKPFKKGIAYEDFSTNPMVVAFASKQNIDNEKIERRLQFSKYLYNPLLRSFRSVVRITALVLKAVKCFKKLRISKLVKQGKLEKDALKEFDVKPINFEVFAVINEENNIEEVEDIYAANNQPVQDEDRCEKVKNDLHSFFTSNCGKLSDLGIILTDEELDAALSNLYSKATMEIHEFVPKKTIEKEGIEINGILFAKTRILEEQELRVMGELDEMLDLECFTGVKFRVPLVEKHSPLAIAIAFHMHYNVAPHRGSESVYRVSLQHAKVIGGKALYKAVEEDCIRCKILKKKYIEQMMGPLADSQLSISPVFYCSLVDMWGPVRTYCPGYERTGYTRGTVSHAKHYEVYFLVIACVVSGAVNVQVIEKKTTEAVLDGLSRFFNECSVPKVMLPDADGALMEALRDGVIEMSNLDGTLSVEYGIQFEVCLPQGHWEHGRVERRIRMLQETMEKCNLRGTRCHATGLQTIAKAIERQVNDIPLGLLEQPTRGGNVLRILTPNMLRMNTKNRAPKGLLTIPNKASDLMKNVQKIYNLWFQVWNDVYLPMAAEYKKWPSKQENLQVGDIVLFKIKDSVFASVWKIGKIDEVHISRDGLVRGVDVSYKLVDPGYDEARHMVVQRPVKQIVKLFHISDTSLIDDIAKVRKISEEITKKRNKVVVEEDHRTEVTPRVPDSDQELAETDDTMAKVKLKQEGEELKVEVKADNSDDDDEGFMKTEVEVDIKHENESVGGTDSEAENEDNTDCWDIKNENLSDVESREQSEPEDKSNDEETSPEEYSNNKDQKKRRKSEMERLLIENEKFWKSFDERKSRSANAAYFARNLGEQMFMLPGMQTDSTNYDLNYSYGEGLGLEEGTVSLL